MNKDRTKYIEKNNNTKVIRTEILFTPLLVILPLIVGIVFIYDWYNRGFLPGNPAFDIELMLGIIILIGNIIFDIPFITFLMRIRKKIDFLI